MGTSYNAQINCKKGEYQIQFETDNREYFKLVEKACQKAIDKRNKAVNKNRALQMQTVGHL